ncbi:hypothetical protein OAF48_05005 [Flavobacteriaceae bacterium]|jgi:hypothetical protein|nr:hypothetical protein [Flavobacteriaceae bacterium]
MDFNRLIKDSKEGIKRKISSRREKISISVAEFNNLSKKYFNQIKEGENLIISHDKKDKETLLFILRWYYNLWIDINEDSIEIYYSFPKEFEIISEVNKSNHTHTPKTFKKGTKMYFNFSSYSSSNWLNGIPLWDNKDEEVDHGLKPSCQINYDYIKIANS